MTDNVLLRVGKVVRGGPRRFRRRDEGVYRGGRRRGKDTGRRCIPRPAPRRLRRPAGGGRDRHRRRRPKRIERGPERGGRGLLLITSADRLRCVINPRRRATALCVNLPSRVGTIIRPLQLRRSRARQYTFSLDQVRLSSFFQKKIK